MGNPGLVIIINDWFVQIIRGIAYQVERQAIGLALSAYYAREKETINSPHYNPDFDWGIERVLIYEINQEEITSAPTNIESLH